MIDADDEGGEIRQIQRQVEDVGGSGCAARLGGSNEMVAEGVDEVGWRGILNFSYWFEKLRIESNIY